MGKSQQSFNKKEREKKRRKRAKEKKERREQRKLEKAEKGKLSFEEQLSYVDADGNLTSTPPDPNKKEKIKAEDIVLGIPPKEKSEEEPFKRGVVTSFNFDKGYGFIKESKHHNSIFVHLSDAYEDIQINDKVIFETEMGPKGERAIQVKPEPVEEK